VLGGTAEVARLFDVRMPSVSDWKRDGIPHARMMLLRETRKEQLGDIDLAAATAARRGRRAKPAKEVPHG
jgi:phage terminase Nu1 subunit (DNA packaging protein)